MKKTKVNNTLQNVNINRGVNLTLHSPKSLDRDAYIPFGGRVQARHSCRMGYFFITSTDKTTNNN